MTPSGQVGDDADNNAVIMPSVVLLNDVFSFLNNYFTLYYCVSRHIGFANRSRGEYVTRLME